MLCEYGTFYNIVHFIKMKKKKRIIHIKECFKTPQIKLEKINRVLVFECLWQIVCFLISLNFVPIYVVIIVIF